MKSITKTKRVFFIVNDKPEGPAFREEVAEFDWYMGMNWQMRLKSSKSLHESILREYPSIKILEVSTKSDNYELGKALSAFNLKLNGIPVENVFQASKVFNDGGPYLELLEVEPAQAKKDPRLMNEAGRILVSFNLYGKEYPTEPKSAFYDYIYITALSQNKRLLGQVVNYNAFTDIEFNQKTPYAKEKGPFNCQARACAICAWLAKNDLLEKYLKSAEKLVEKIYPQKKEQLTLFD